MNRLKLRRINSRDSNPKKDDVSESRNYWSEDTVVTGYAPKDTKKEFEEILWRQ